MALLSSFSLEGGGGRLGLWPFGSFGAALCFGDVIVQRVQNKFLILLRKWLIFHLNRFLITHCIGFEFVREFVSNFS